MLGHFIVEHSARIVRLVRLPVNSLRAGRPRLLANSFDQSSSYATTTLGRNSKQILEVAGWLNLGCAAMKNVVREPDELPFAFGD